MSFKKTLYFFLFIVLFNSTCHVLAVNLSAKSAILMDAESGFILNEKEADNKIYPASTTKILTSIIAIENLNLDDVVVVTEAGINIPWDSSKSNLIVGEVITVRNLLYCTLLSSGNDAANMLAEAVSGSVDNFLILIGEKLKLLGCKNTNFINVHGYHDDNHYTTAYDMAIILKYAIQNKTFNDICQTTIYTVPATNKSKQRKLVNTNRLILTTKQSKLAYPYQYAIGGKTGYTTEAGRCFVGWAKKDDKCLIACVFNAPVDGIIDKKFIDSVNLFEYGFNNFEKKEIISKEAYVFKFIDKKNNYEYIFKLKENLSILKKRGVNIEKIKYIINVDDINFNKLLDGSQQCIGITFNITDNETSSSNIYANLCFVEKTVIKSLDINAILSAFFYVSIILLVLSIFFFNIQNYKDRSNTKLDNKNLSRKRRRY